MTRDRRPDDWQADLAAARGVEQEVGALLAADARFVDVADRTESFDELDFSFRYRGLAVTLDVKEKRQHYSAGIRELWPTARERDLFVVDETVFRRIVWQGGGGYLLIHDVPGQRWVVFGPWELTLGPKVRYGRWGRRRASRFLKGKLLVNLAASAGEAPTLTGDLVAAAIDGSVRWLAKVEPYPIHGARLRELGG